jgi:D-alanyl-D-alanine carboxypeptidase/D-alanyl-D-alanine-endopeptidase (penicillin-binding protein 4)
MDPLSEPLEVDRRRSPQLRTLWVNLVDDVTSEASYVSRDVLSYLDSTIHRRTRFACRSALRWAGAAVLLIASLWVHAAAPAGLPTWIGSTLREAGIPEEAVAVYVKEAGTGSSVISHNATVPFKPASIIKVLTTFSALEILGEDYVWHTPVYVTGAVQSHELRGNLIFRGVGDPSLNYERMRAFSSQLYRRGIRVIKGDVIIDKSYFGFNSDLPEQFYGEVENPWNLPPQPMLVNGKLVTLTVTPVGGAAAPKAKIEPDLPSVRLENEASHAPGACGSQSHGISIEAMGDAKSATIRVSGSLPDQCGPVVKRISVLGIDEYFAASFRRSYEEQGGRIEGDVKSGQSVAQARLLSTIQSGPLMDVIRETNKNSNNLMARQLFVTVGAILTSKPPSPASAAKALLPWIAEKVPETSSFVLENGSGLSEEERVTAKGMVALLDYIRTSRHAAQFLDTLPAVGEDGTMRIRLRDQPVAGRSVAKTGTLHDTRAIAGIVVSKRGRSYVFCVIVNHPKASSSVPIIDKLIVWLHDLPESRRSGDAR